MISPLTPIPNIQHTSSETAFYIHKYPYSYGQHTVLKVWLETKPTYGERCVIQIFDPNSNKWFKAKYGSYFDIVVLELETAQTNPFKEGLFKKTEINFSSLHNQPSSHNPSLQQFLYYYQNALSDIQKQKINEEIENINNPVKTHQENLKALTDLNLNEDEIKKLLHSQMKNEKTNYNKLL